MAIKCRQAMRLYLRGLSPGSRRLSPRAFGRIPGGGCPCLPNRDQSQPPSLVPLPASLIHQPSALLVLSSSLPISIPPSENLRTFKQSSSIYQVHRFHPVVALGPSNLSKTRPSETMNPTATLRFVTSPPRLRYPSLFALPHRKRSR